MKCSIVIVMLLLLLMIYLWRNLHEMIILSIANGFNCKRSDKIIFSLKICACERMPSWLNSYSYVEVVYHFCKNPSSRSTFYLILNIRLTWVFFGPHSFNTFNVNLGRLESPSSSHTRVPQFTISAIALRIGFCNTSSSSCRYYFRTILRDTKN